MKKKYVFGTLALSMAIAASASVLSGCGSSSGGNDTSDIQWYMVGNPMPDLDSVMAEVSKMTKEKIGVGVKMVVNSYSDHMTKMQTKVNSGEKFDCFFTDTKNYADYARNNSIVDITDMIKTDGKEMLEKIPTEVFDQAKLNGKLYGVPTYKELAWQYTWIVNVPIAQKYGIDYKNELKGLDDIEPILKKVQAGEGSDFDVLLPQSAGSSIAPDVKFEAVSGIDFGVKFDPNNPSVRDTTIYNRYEIDEQKAYYKTMRKYYQEGFMPKDLNVNSSEVMKTGKWFLTTVNYQPEYEHSESAALGYDIDVVNRHTPVMSGTTGAINAIPKSCTRPDTALKFLNLVNSDEKIRQTIGYGIEGTHWTKNAEGKRVITSQGQTGYSGISNYAVGNLFITGLAEKDRDDKWEQFDKYNKSATESPLLNFYFDETNVKSELANYNSVTKQYKNDLATGRVDPDEILPTFIQKMKDAGSEKIRAEVQKQYDEFRQKNSK